MLTSWTLIVTIHIRRCYPQEIQSTCTWSCIIHPYSCPLLVEYSVVSEWSEVVLHWWGIQIHVFEVLVRCLHEIQRLSGTWSVFQLLECGTVKFQNCILLSLVLFKMYRYFSISFCLMVVACLSKYLILCANCVYIASELICFPVNDSKRQHREQGHDQFMCNKSRKVSKLYYSPQDLNWSCEPEYLCQGKQKISHNLLKMELLGLHGS
jgi:hypothetical protein